MITLPASANNPEIPSDYLRTYGLEFFAADHCVFKCFGCSQCSPYLDAKFAAAALFEKSIKILERYLRPERLTILGGEPLLHPEINDIISIAKKSGMFNRIFITTNASNLDKMTQTFWDYIDVLTISKYSTNAGWLEGNLDWISKKCEANRVELEIRPMDNFNYIVLSEKNSRADLVKEIYDKCIYKHYCHTLSEGKLFRCSPVVNFKKYQQKLGNNRFDDEGDYLPIQDHPGLKTEIFRYLDSKTPLKGCSYCLGSSGKPFTQRQLTADELKNPVRTKISEINYDNYR